MNGVSLYDFCLANNLLDLLGQWNTEKNGQLTPKDVARGSKQKVWWRCKYGHEWEAEIKARVNGNECPVCARHLVVPGINDLATTHSHIAKQWHPTKNGTLMPTDIAAGTNRKVWWLCEKNHEWNARVGSRTGLELGCPICSGKLIVPGINDLRTGFPEIAAQWHPTKNGDVMPDTVAPYSNRTFWWICELGHEYSMAVNSRTHGGSGCPYCANRRVLPGFNDLASTEPQIAAQWHQELNADLTPEMVTAGSHKKVWWQCPEGHVWKAVIGSRTGNQRNGCPVCAGKIQKNQNSRYEEIKFETL